MLVKTKSFNLNSVEGADVTPEVLSKINKYAMKTLATEDVYVRKYLMAHNAIDRDRERFPEDLLDDFARTLPGKSFLEVHDKSRLPLGRYFDAFTEEMTKAKFKELTGEEIRLPEGMKEVKVVYGLIYLVKADFNDKIIANIEAGIYSHASIGFSASNLVDIKDDDGQLLYREYVGPGEAREGSIVYLGAQQGASLQKSAEQSKGSLVSTPDDKMSIVPKEDKQECPFIKDVSSNIDDEMSIVPKEDKRECPHATDFKSSGSDEKMQRHGSHTHDKKNESHEDIGNLSISPYKTGVNKENNVQRSSDMDKVGTESEMSEVGREYRKELEKSWLMMKTSLGDISYDASLQEQARETVKNYSIDLLKSEVKSLEKRRAELLKTPETKSDDALNDKMSIVPKEEDALPPGAHYDRGRLVVPKMTYTPGLGGFRQGG